MKCQKIKKKKYYFGFIKKKTRAIISLVITIIPKLRDEIFKK